MGVTCTFYEETPVRVKHYLNHHEWPDGRSELRLRYYDTGKLWTGLHCLFIKSGTNNTFPGNFIMNGLSLPNYEIDEEYKDDRHAVELTAPFLYSAGETKKISKFLDSLDKKKLREGFNPQYFANNAFPYEYYDDAEDQDDYFHGLYYSFLKLQRLFQKTVINKNCIIGRMS